MPNGAEPHINYLELLVAFLVIQAFIRDKGEAAVVARPSPQVECSVAETS